jgi:uncharacterized membrane protein
MDRIQETRFTKELAETAAYMVVHLVFVMISNYFPVATYGNTYDWWYCPSRWIVRREAVVFGHTD